MRKYLLLALAACVVLSGCSKSKDEETTAAVTSAAVETTVAESTAPVTTEAPTKAMLTVDDVIQAVAGSFNLSGDISMHVSTNINTSTSSTDNEASALPADTGLVSDATQPVETNESGEAVEESEAEETTEIAAEMETKESILPGDTGAYINVNVPVKINADLDISRIGDVIHTEGSLVSSVFLQSVDADIDSYGQVSGTIVKQYTHKIDSTVPDDICWSISEETYDVNIALDNCTIYVPLRDLLGKAKMTENDEDKTYTVSGEIKYSDIVDENNALLPYLKDCDVSVMYVINKDDYAVLSYSMSLPSGEYKGISGEDEAICTVSAFESQIDFTWPPTGASSIPSEFIEKAEKYDGRKIQNIDGVDVVVDKDGNVIDESAEAAEESSEAVDDSDESSESEGSDEGGFITAG